MNARTMVTTWLVPVASLLLVVAQVADLATGVFAIAYLVVVPGLVIVRLWPGRTSAPAVTVGVSASVLVLLGSIMLWADWWHPRWATGIVASLCAAGWLRAVRRRSPHTCLPTLRFARPSGWAAATWGLLSAALVCWLVALGGIDPADASPHGLLTGAPMTFSVALTLAVAAFLLAVRVRSMPAAVAGLVLTGAVLRLTTALVSPEPMYDWAQKHLGVVDAFLVNGRIDGSIDIYHDWPGLFSATAWLSAASGVAPDDIAVWFTAAITVLTAWAVHGLARQMGADAWGALVAAYLFVVWNWIGQDYFAPQSLAMFLAVVVLRLALVRAEREDLLAVVLFTALVVSHQLTPYWVLGALGLLALLRRARWLLVLAAGSVALGYLALHFDAVADFGLFSGVDVAANAQTGGKEWSSDARQLDSLMSRIATVAVWAATAAVLGWRSVARSRRESTDPGVAMVLAFSPLCLLLAQSYGGEAILRVALYSLAGCSVVLGPVVHRILTAPSGRGRHAVRSVGAALAAVGFVLVTTATSAQAYFGPWYVYQVPTAEVAVARALLDEAPRPAYLAPAVTGWPDRSSGSYVVWLDDAPDFDASAFDPMLTGTDFADEADLLAWEKYLTLRHARPVFVIFTPRMEVVNAYRGFYADDALSNLREALDGRVRWTTVLEHDGIDVRRFVPPGTEESDAALWEVE